VIRLMVPDLQSAEIEAAADVLRAGHLVQGERVREFEGVLAEVLGVDSVVAVSSGTAALYLALKVLGIGPGDAVAVPAYTWPATANVVVLAGAEPIFIDIEPASLGMDPRALDLALRRTSNIKAIMPVHPFGRMVDMEAISAVPGARRTLIVEDAACALGATLRGRAAGAWGQMGCLSFHPRKVVTTGEGGAVATDDRSLVRQLRMLRNHGLDPAAERPDFAIAGYNLRLTEFQAILGTGQVRRLNHILAQRRALSAAYDSCFRGTGIESLLPLEPAAHTYQSYVVLLPADFMTRRDSTIAALKLEGIEATIGTHHVPLTSYYRRRFGHKPGDFPVTDAAAARCLTLPLHRDLDEQTVRWIATVLLKLVGQG
jgi:perosamine synthetase